ncbi:hypothetical protein FDECE_15085 [Fusarium decemcellulare]|nr:hypothetical protein FDECE_15085 [Fusarium decemcellulare]
MAALEYDFTAKVGRAGARKRASGPKSRGGCMSCKRMHLKCDENKPSCLRCSKVQRICEYFEPTHEDTVVRDRPLRNLYPKAVAPALFAQPTLMPLKGKEAMYFELFRYQVSQDFAYSPCTLFWNRIIPRESMRDDCVRYSVLSIGALIKTFRHPDFKPGVPVTNPLLETHRHAVQYHTQAITELKARMTTDFLGISRRSVLINMFLMFLFELLYGDTEAADQLLAKSVQLLTQKKDQLQEEITSTFNPHRASLYAAVSNDDGLKQAEVLLPRLQLFLSLNTPFYRRQRERCSQLDARPMPDCIPPTTISFAGMRAMWNSFMTRGVVFVVKVLREMASGSNETIPLHLAAYQVTFLHQLDEWERALQQRRHHVSNDLELQMVKVWEMQHKTLFILMSCCLDTTEMVYDDFAENFQTILSSAVESAGSFYDSRVRVALDIYTLPILNLLSQKCRIAQIRLEALGLSARLSSVMGGWEAKASLLTRQYLIGLEESSRDSDGIIPASGRYIWTDALWNESRTRLTAVFTSARPNSRGVRELRYFSMARSALDN